MPSIFVKTTEKGDIPLDKFSRFQSGTCINGNLTSTDCLYFNGTLTGDINLSNKLILGEESQVTGNIYATHIVVMGKVNGNLFIKEQASFEQSANFTGRIVTKSIEIKVGAVFNAQCSALNAENTVEMEQGTEENFKNMPLTTAPQEKHSYIDAKSFFLSDNPSE